MTRPEQESVSALAADDLPIVRAPKNPGRAWLALAMVFAVVLVLTSAWRQGWFTPTSHVYLEISGANGIQWGTPVDRKSVV